MEANLWGYGISLGHSDGWLAILPVMNTGLVLLAFGLVFLSGSALLALWWALKDGQIQNLEEASAVIFDAEEPVGVLTDAFPGTRLPRQTDRVP